MTRLHQLHEQGQSTWLNYMRRAFIRSGGLRKLIEEGIQGVTANAVAFADTICQHGDYDDEIQRQLVGGVPCHRIHEALMVNDTQRAADLLRPVFEESDGLDGFASLELDPALAHETINLVATARCMLAAIDRGNTMVEIPATHEGCDAIRLLTADGVSINATHLFTVSDFERVAQAYIAGLESYFETHSVWRGAPTTVASFSVAAIDGVVDEALAEHGLDHLQGRTGIAMSRLLYDRFREIFHGPRWERLAHQGARLLRPKWTRIAPATEDCDEVYYAEALIGPDTVMTFDLSTLAAFQERGQVAQTITQDLDRAEAHLVALTEAGIGLDSLVDALQERHLAESNRDYRSLISSVAHKLYPGIVTAY